MKNIFHVFYLGEEPEINSAGKEYFDKKNGPLFSYNFTLLIPHPTLSLSDIIKEKNCSLIIIDFTHHGLNVPHLVTQIELLKHHDVYKQIVFAGMFKDKKSLEEHKYMNFVGLNYTFIKGNDFSLFLDDLFYVAFDEDPGFQAFARADNLHLTYSPKVPALITQINETSIVVNTDIEFTETSLEIEHTFLGQKKTNAFEITSINPCPGPGDSLLTYHFSIPYPGPWTQTDPDAILQDTVETFLADYNDFLPIKGRCLIWSNEQDLFDDLLKNINQLPLEIFLEQESIETKVFLLRPDLIIFDHRTDSEDRERKFLSMMKAIKSVDFYAPVVVIFSSQESAEHLRTTLGYQKLIAHQSSCEVKILQLLLDKHIQKQKDEDAEWKYFNISDLNAQVQMKLKVIITSVSEHVITFFCQNEIPMYSNLRFDVPVDCDVLIIPPLRELRKTPGAEHYMGIIHGIDHHESNYLRKFVNQIIFSPLKSFEKIELTQAASEESMPMENQPIRKREKVAVEQQLRPRRRKFNKSKL